MPNRGVLFTRDDERFLSPKGITPKRVRGPEEPESRGRALQARVEEADPDPKKGPSIILPVTALFFR